MRSLLFLVLVVSGCASAPVAGTHEHYNWCYTQRARGQITTPDCEDLFARERQEKEAYQRWCSAEYTAGRRPRECQELIARWDARLDAQRRGVVYRNPDSMTPEEIAAMEEAGRQQRAAIVEATKKWSESTSRAGERLGRALAGIPEPDTCCKHCAPNSQPCGDTCISLDYTCHTPPGCACY